MTAGVLPALEIAVTGPAGARVARDGGADRVEVCAALELGGVTPSAALVEATVAVGLPVHALVRCRPGDFVHDAEEVALMAAEAASVVRCGAAGVVVGVLRPDGRLDTGAVRRLADAARRAADGRAVEVTLHRAVDHCEDPVALAALSPSLGVTRVLSSGGAVRAADGLPVLRAMAVAAPGVQVMAGGGVRPSDVPALAGCGVAAVHLSAKRRAPLPPGRPRVPLGSADRPRGDAYFVTDPAVVAAARAAVDALRRPGPAPR